jgi:hypothetical protein
MIDTLKKGLLKLAQSAAQEVACPRCQHRFKPFATAPPGTFSELTYAVPCPKCGYAFRFDDGVKTSAEAKANPPGPFEKPADSRIEMIAENGAWTYQIPRGRSPRGLMFMAVFWNLISWPLAYGAFAQNTQGRMLHFVVGWTIPLLFPLIGLGLLYTVLRLGFATHRLTLGPQTVRLRRKVIFSKDYEVPVGEITNVRKTSFYTQNYQPVYGIEITAGARKIRFGSALTEDEKNWLCWQIREFARQRGAPLGS